jgi:hypothetical protein
MNSFKCFNIGAKWCIGTKNDPSYWKRHVLEDEKCFIFVYNNKTKKKWMWEATRYDEYNFWDDTDDKIDSGSIFWGSDIIELELSDDILHNISVLFENELDEIFETVARPIILEKEKDVKYNKCKEILLAWWDSISHSITQYDTVRKQEDKDLVMRIQVLMPGEEDTLEQRVYNFMSDLSCVDEDKREEEFNYVLDKLKNDAEFMKALKYIMNIDRDGYVLKESLSFDDIYRINNENF